MGMLASASVGDSTGVYEPIHGSAHDIAGKEVANPMASVFVSSVVVGYLFRFEKKKQTRSDQHAVDQVLKLVSMRAISLQRYSLEYDFWEQTQLEKKF